MGRHVEVCRSRSGSPAAFLYFTQGLDRHGRRWSVLGALAPRSLCLPFGRTSSAALSRKRLLSRETRTYVAALLPVVSDGDRSDRAIVATNYQQFQAQSPIFVSREKQRSIPVPVQKEFHTDVDGTVPFARDISGIVPLSEGLFVARTKEAGQ